MPTDLFGDDKVILDITRDAYRHRRRSQIIGTLLILTGILAIVFPFVMTVAAELLAGTVLVTAAVAEFVHAFQCRSWKGSLVNGLTGMISLAFGLIFLLFPLTGMISLTLLIAVLFFASGTFRVAVATRLRPYDGWAWLMLSGVVGIVLGLLITLMLPQAAGWVLGVMIGLDLLFAGWWLLSVAISAGKIGS